MAVADDRMSELYLAIISRYRGYIEEKEEISVAELPILVTPKAEDITAKAEEIKAGFSAYFYDRDFPDAAQRAFDFVSKSIEEVALPVQFWLTPEETMRFRAGDMMDKSILLCSLLIALGNASAKVFMLIRESERVTQVYFEFRGAVTMLDFSGPARKYASKEDLFRSFGIMESDTAYEFNNRSYTDIY